MAAKSHAAGIGGQLPKAKSMSIAKGINPGSPPSAAERMSMMGSSLFRGPQAAPEPAKAKPAMPGGAKAAPQGKAAAQRIPAGAAIGPGAASSGTVPLGSVTNMVSVKPTASGGSPPSFGGGPSVGAARQLAAAAASTLDKSDGRQQIPREGPAAVAVARSAAVCGYPTIIQSGGKPRTLITKKYQIVLVSAECAPFSKTGGLGEAVDGLSVALAALGHRVMVVTPRYDQFEEAWDTGFWRTIKMGGKDEPVHFFHTYKQKVDIVFVDHPAFLEAVWGKTEGKLYGPTFGEDYVDNQCRFAYFCKAALLAIRDLPLGGCPYGEKCVVLANDWHSALVPVFMEVERRASGQWRNWQTKTAILTHNALYQGRFAVEPKMAEIFGVPQSVIDDITFNMGIEVGEKKAGARTINHLAAGLKYADYALTVAPTYAYEICNLPQFGCELEKMYSAKKCIGILNGIKENISPADKNFMAKASVGGVTYTAQTVNAGKSEILAAYRKRSGLPNKKGPLIGFLGRVDVQKGYDLTFEAVKQIIGDTDFQFVVIGSGRPDLVAKTRRLSNEFPDKVVYEGWMGPERYGVIAACDYVIFTSRWEPCGLVQMEAMRLGTVPIVAPTGGLKDTVEDGVTGFWTDQPMKGDCVIDRDSVASVVKVLKRVVNFHTGSPEEVSRMRKNTMAAAAEFTWSNAALQYEAIFKEMGAVDVLPECPDKTVTLEADLAIG